MAMKESEAHGVTALIRGRETMAGDACGNLRPREKEMAGRLTVKGCHCERESILWRRLGCLMSGWVRR